MSLGRDLKVGLFVVAGLLFSAVVIFLIGNERNLFSPATHFRTTFQDVAGLKPGAPVRMGGLDIGQVSEVGYSKKDASDTTVYVTFWIVDAEKQRIRDGAKARIATKGLLGDKMVELTLGDGQPLPKDALIPSDSTADIMATVGGVAQKAGETLENINRVAEPLGDEKLHKDIQGSVASLNVILHEVAHGEGYPKRFLSDKQEAERISRVIDSLEATSTSVNALLGDVRRVVARVEHGPGFAHDLIYSQSPKGVTEFSAAAGELALTLKGVRESNSLANDLLYGGKGDTAQMISNLNTITGDVAAIVSDVRKGKGTVGGLLVDPSIYDDLKVVLGNVQRNDVLRALVRYSIKQDEKKPEVKVGSQP